MSKVLQERGFRSLPSSTKTNPRDHVKSISTIVEADSYPIRRMRSYHTLMYETKQMKIPFLCHLNGYYCEEKKESYGSQFSEAYYEASHINNSIPRKEKDLGRASVSVMPLSTYLNLGLDELAHTKLTVELADRTVKYPKGIAENVLVGIGKFVFPVYFIILDMPEDIKVPLILGRPFLSSVRAKIDVFKRKITLRCEEKKESYGPQFSEAYYEASHINNSIPRKEKDLGRASVSVMPLSTYLNLGLDELAHTKLTVELADRTVKYPKGIAENMLVGIGKFVFPVYFIILDMPEDIKVPLILGRPFLSTVRAKIDVFKRKITLRVGEEKIIFKSVKPTSSLIKRVYMLSLRERMELDLEARLIGETLV
ncbi:zinc finger, CCHC-type containing protein, partial [Tanacetum coccineum]